MHCSSNCFKDISRRQRSPVLRRPFFVPDPLCLGHTFAGPRPLPLPHPRPSRIGPGMANVPRSIAVVHGCVVCVCRRLFGSCLASLCGSTSPCRFRCSAWWPKVLVLVCRAASHLGSWGRRLYLPPPSSCPPFASSFFFSFGWPVSVVRQNRLPGRFWEGGAWRCCPRLPGRVDVLRAHPDSRRRIFCSSSSSS